MGGLAVVLTLGDDGLWRSAPSPMGSALGSHRESSSEAASISGPITVNAVLQLPTATATAKPKPTAIATPTPAIAFWEGQTTPGIYLIPPPTPVPPTPLAACTALMTPETVCVVPTAAMVGSRYP